MKRRYPDEFYTYADLADRAMKTGALIPPVQELWPDCTVENAYQLQFYNVKRRLADGWQLGGYKVGVIADGAQRAMDTLQPVFGVLYERMFLQSGNQIPFGEMNAPLMEVEVALTAAAAVEEPIFSAADAVRLIKDARIAFEVVSNRLDRPVPNAAALIADGTAARYSVLGGRRISGAALCGMDRGEVWLDLNGERIETGDLSAIFGTPLRSFVWLANTLLAHGRKLERGDIVMTGSATEAVPVPGPGRYTAGNDLLGGVEVTFI